MHPLGKFTGLMQMSLMAGFPDLDSHSRVISGVTNSTSFMCIDISSFVGLELSD